MEHVCSVHARLVGPQTSWNLVSTSRVSVETLGFQAYTTVLRFTWFLRFILRSSVTELYLLKALPTPNFNSKVNLLFKVFIFKPLPGVHTMLQVLKSTLIFEGDSLE